MGAPSEKGFSITSPPVDRSRTEQIELSRERARRVAAIADDYRGRRTVILDLTAITPIVDFFVISTGTSRRQMHALVDEIQRVLKEAGIEKLGLEGYDNNSTWVLLDFGDIVLHVQTEEARELYDLDRLWADAPLVEWSNPDTPDAGVDRGDTEK